MNSDEKIVIEIDDFGNIHTLSFSINEIEINESNDSPYDNKKIDMSRSLYLPYLIKNKVGEIEDIILGTP